MPHQIEYNGMNYVIDTDETISEFTKDFTEALDRPFYEHCKDFVHSQSQKQLFHEHILAGLFEMEQDYGNLDVLLRYCEDYAATIVLRSSFHFLWSTKRDLYKKYVCRLSEVAATKAIMAVMASVKNDMDENGDYPAPYYINGYKLCFMGEFVEALQLAEKAGKSEQHTSVDE